MIIVIIQKVKSKLIKDKFIRFLDAGICVRKRKGRRAMNPKHLYEEAIRFITTCYSELSKEQEVESRLQQIKSEIEETNTYEHTFEELVHGAKMAWRNSNRCIGRLFWNSLHVLDAREATTEEDVLEALSHHIQYATNEGKILPTITIFKPYLDEHNQIRIYNHQLIRYAGYETTSGVIGDSDSLDFTKFCEKLGWKGKQGRYDILPWVVSIDAKPPVWMSVPIELVREIPIEHPTLPFHQLDMKWYAVPIISDMRLEIGGISYCAAPFNGWYMGTEIGARNLADDHRYGFLPAIAEIMELDTSKKSSLWKDKALIELNIAVLFSYKKQGVTIVDHHTAAEQFALFEQQEAKSARLVTGNWVWLIPPISPATTHIYHRPYANKVYRPNYFHQKTSYEI